MAILLAIWLMVLPPVKNTSRSPAAPPPFRVGQTVRVVGYDMSAQNPRYWRRDLEIEQRARAEFKKEKLFRVVMLPAKADFVFVIVYDQSSDDFAESGLAVRSGDFGAGGAGLDALQAEALWSGLSHQHMFLKSSWLRWVPSSARDLVKQFCKATGLNAGHGPGELSPRRE